jgi:hypothetical protein
MDPGLELGGSGGPCWSHSVAFDLWEFGKVPTKRGYLRGSDRSLPTIWDNLIFWTSPAVPVRVGKYHQQI